MRLLKLALVPSICLFAVYTYFFTDTFASGINGASWYSNGTVAGGADGLVSAAANGGSVIYKNAIPDGTAEYEVKATLKIAASGGTFTLYLRASADALTGPATQGSYYAMEMTPAISSGGCTMAANHYKRVAGTVTLLASHSFACANNMTVRLVQRGGYYMGLTSFGELIFVPDGALTTGQPGFGARALPAGNGISVAQIGPADRVAPNAFMSQNVRSAVFDNRVDLAWTGVVDDANGSGIALYQIYRNGAFYSNFRTANWTDTAVSPSTTYTYQIRAIDMNHNLSYTTVTVATPVAGMRDPRKTGVRPLGTYWGASPESIDLQSGNLSFSLPTVTAQGRGGTAVPFRLSYNSQNWRKDSGGIWMLGADVGFGWGWKMLVGSLTPVYSSWWTVNHYLYTDNTGAEYRLDTNAGGVWTSKEGIFLSYDSATGRLYYPGGNFWEFGCVANGTEADAGTLYPTRLVDTNGNEVS
ncbi:MAG: hypothetical protein ACKV2U_21960 [Bryobacteraceae bacterium]